MSFHRRISATDLSHMTARQFSRLALAGKAEAMAHMGPPPARPKNSDTANLDRYWCELERLGEIDREWQSALVEALRDVETGKRDLSRDNLSDILTPEVIARFRNRDYLAVSAEAQAVINRSAATLFGLAQGMPKKAAEMACGQTGEVERILAHPERAVDRLVYEGFLTPERAHEMLGSLRSRKDVRQMA